MIELTQKCMLLLGGSFDPVHSGHVELGKYFCQLFKTDILRLIPAGNPWQKSSLSASSDHRVAMLEQAFADSGLAFTIDHQEIDRPGATYSFDTLSNIRHEVGDYVSLVFLMGADQLHRLHTWYRWRELLNLANFAVSTRPGSVPPLEGLPLEVAEMVFPCIATSDEIAATPAGKILIDNTLHIDISSTDIRNALRNGQNPGSLIPPAVLGYINDHQLYRN